MPLNKHATPVLFGTPAALVCYRGGNHGQPVFLFGQVAPAYVVLSLGEGKEWLRLEVK